VRLCLMEWMGSPRLIKREEPGVRGREGEGAGRECVDGGVDGAVID
jgi:hypothetical protein